MNIISLPIDQIVPYENNPRKNEKAIEKVAMSIKEFGFKQPIVVDLNNVVIAGHTRLLAAKKLGMIEIPVIVADNLNESQIKAYRLADNRVSEEADWDIKLLSDEIVELDKLGFDLNLTGFNGDELHAFLNPEEFMEALTDEDHCPGLGEDTIAKPGDIFILGKHRLMCGDSTNPEHVQRLYANYQPILMVTDPPYGVDYDPKWREDANLGVGKRSKGKVKNDTQVDWKEAYSLFTGHIAYVWHAGKYSDIIATNLKDLDFEIVSQIIWAKQHFAISRGDYHWQHEPCWYAVKKGHAHNWQGARDQSTIWEIKNNNSFGNSEKEKTWGHGTQKPVECMYRPVINNTRVNDCIYDPFGGSGTTLIACEKSTRICLMMEIDPKYCDVIIKRWEEFTGKQAILETL